MARKFQHIRGLKANLPKLSLAEMALTTDEKKLYFGDGNENIRLLDQKDKAEINTQLTSNENDLKSRGINAKFPPPPLVGAKGNNLDDDTVALQNLINFISVNNKILLLPKGTYLISAPLVLPQDPSRYGIELSGAKSETKYQNLPGSTSTVIKAISTMPSMITNRGSDSRVNVAFYNVVKNLVLDGNNVAERGYVNGWQDKFIDSTVVRCTKYGVSLGDLTNNTLIRGVTMTLNQKGFESSGFNSTVWRLENCTVRENVSDGATITSGLGSTISGTIFESNGGKGVHLIRDTNNLRNIRFYDCYFENNSDYDVEIDAVSNNIPNNIEFDNLYILSHVPKAINIKKGNNISFKKPNLGGGEVLVDGYFVNDGGTNVTIEHDENIVNSVKYSGVLASDIIKIMTKFGGATKGIVINKVLKAPIVKPNSIVAGYDRTLTNEEVSGTIITNSTQTSAATVLLPSPTESYEFKAICTVASNAIWKISTVNSASIIYLNGEQTTKSSVQIAVPRVGDYIEFTSFRRGDGTYCWIAKPVVGNWT